MVPGRPLFDPQVDNGLDLRIAQIRRYVPMVDLLRQFGMDYPDATAQIRCPFHDDHAPSARLYTEQQKVYCFTEQKSWDVVDAVQTLRTCSLPDAVRWLEETFSVPALAATLQSSIRTQLSQRMPPSLGPSAELVETRLKAARHALGFAAYTKLLQGLDLTVWEATTRAIQLPVALERFKQILGRIPKTV
jgi:hypothetical protein